MVAVKVAVSPLLRVRAVLFKLMLVTATVTAATVTVQVTVFPPASAVIFAEPAAMAVTLPLLSTVTTLASLLLHVTVLSVALLGLTVAVSVSVAPGVRVSEILFKRSPVTATVALETVTVQVADLFPAFAVIVAVPAATAVTLPPLSVATFVLLLLHVTVLSVALLGLTVAVSVAFAPVVRERLVLFKLIPVTATVALETVTVQVADLFPAFAVIVAVPAPTAVTLPPLTVATFVLLLLHVTVLSVALLGLTVAVKDAVSPVFIDKLLLLTETPVTAMLAVPLVLKDL